MCTACRRRRRDSRWVSEANVLFLSRQMVVTPECVRRFAGVKTGSLITHLRQAGVARAEVGRWDPNLRHEGLLGSRERAQTALVDRRSPLEQLLDCVLDGRLHRG